MDRIGFVYDREGEGSEPVAIITLQEGVLRFHARPGGGMEDACSRLNSGAAELDGDEAADYFETYADRWNGQAKHTTVVAMVGRDARRAQTMIAKWGRAAK